ncbi:MAG: Amuc_1100 family pilus-like protein [Chthoniobacterales bacterium]|nr:Amuc_1100 family pilus-like protein [Chthoniobacterales bacterium]
MKFFRDNPFLIWVGVVFVLVIILLGFLLSQAVVGFAEEWDNYTAQVAKLHRLQNSSPYPSEENLKAKVASIRVFEQALRNVEEKVHSLMGRIPQDITPQNFQDELRVIVSEIEKKAKNAKVQLPEDFYLGMNQYKTVLPTAEAAPQLSRQVRTLKWIIEKLIECGVGKIENLEREQLAVEKEGNTQGENQDRKILRFSPFKIVFTGEYSRVRKAVNELLYCPDFMILRAISVSNSSQQGPPKRSDTSAISGDQQYQALFGNSNESKSVKKEKLNILLGRELVTFQIHFEIIDLMNLFSE